MATVRHDWKISEVLALFDLPFNDLLFKAHTTHRQNFNPNRVQMSALLNIKTGACPEDCAYCSQSARHNTGIKREKLMTPETVLKTAETAKKNGAQRFCMGAAWRNPTDKNLEKVIEIIQAVKALGLETCATLGMLSEKQAKLLKAAGLDYYNHNIDTSEEYYPEVITTRKFSDRIETLNAVRRAGIHVCSGGILGLGENQQDRASMLRTLANLPRHPESVPINALVAIEGTPLEKMTKISDIAFVKTIAVARIMMPGSVVRLSAGRLQMSDAMQALCFFAGANSCFCGDKLLTTENPEIQEDATLFAELGINPEDVKNQNQASEKINQAG